VNALFSPGWRALVPTRRACSWFCPALVAFADAGQAWAVRPERAAPAAVLPWHMANLECRSDAAARPRREAAAGCDTGVPRRRGRERRERSLQGGDAVGSAPSSSGRTGWCAPEGTDGLARRPPCGGGYGFGREWGAAGIRVLAGSLQGFACNLW